MGVFETTWKTFKVSAILSAASRFSHYSASRIILTREGFQENT